MPPLVTMGAMMQCSFGMAPSTLVVIPQGPPVQTEKVLQATIMDFKPIANIPPFGMCQSMANPTVAAATAAALGVLTPMPCVPATVAPWTPGVPTVMVNKVPALNQPCTCNCMWAGVITITKPGSTKSMA